MSLVLNTNNGSDTDTHINEVSDGGPSASLHVSEANYMSNGLISRFTGLGYSIRFCSGETWPHNTWDTLIQVHMYCTTHPLHTVMQHLHMEGHISPAASGTESGAAESGLLFVCVLKRDFKGSAHSWGLGTLYQNVDTIEENWAGYLSRRKKCFLHRWVCSIKAECMCVHGIKVHSY